MAVQILNAAVHERTYRQNFAFPTSFLLASQGYLPDSTQAALPSDIDHIA